MMDFHKECMNTATIRNEELLKILNNISELIKSIDLENVRNYPKDEIVENWVSEDYLNTILRQGRDHVGFPEMIRGFQLAPEHFSYTDLSRQIQICKEAEKNTNDLCSWTGAHRRALSCVYPPGGFISWHNNHNASGYNVLFTWSDTGEGQWEHIDPVSKEHVIIKDIPGWQCKYGYYGSWDDGPEKLLYHAARTECLRTTVAFVFNRDESGKRMAEMLIEEIETP